MAEVKVEQEVKVVLTMTGFESRTLEKFLARFVYETKTGSNLNFSAEQEGYIVSIHQALIKKVY
jgi:hypothetical protein